MLDSSSIRHDVTSQTISTEGFLYWLLDMDRSSTASDVRSVRQLRISLFGGFISGQEKSWGNEEEGS